MNAVDFQEMHDGIVYKLIENEKEAEQALQLMLTVYYKDEPVCKVLRSDDDMSNTKMIRHMIQEGFSMIAVADETQEVIGVKIANTLERDGNEEDERLVSSNTSVRLETKFCLLMDDVDTLFKVLPGVLKCFSSYATVVHSRMRGKGIAKRMNMGILEVAKKGGFKLANLIASNYYTRRIANGLGYKIYKRVLWDEMEIEGEKIFKGEDMGSPECTSHYFIL